MQVHNATAGTIQLNNDARRLRCRQHRRVDRSATSITRPCSSASAWDGTTGTISYSGTGNCSTGLGFPTNCDGPRGLVYTFQRNAWVGRLGAVDWYVGRQRRAAAASLFRLRLPADGC